MGNQSYPNHERQCSRKVHRKTIELIDSSHVRFPRAETLLDQYRKKSQLYQTNVVFIQLGDDFRYTTMDEARKQFENYDKLFTYMNQQADWHVDVRFSWIYLCDQRDDFVPRLNSGH